MLLGRDIRVLHSTIPVASEAGKTFSNSIETFHQLKKYIPSIALIACRMETNYLSAPGIVTLLEYHTTTR
jgi:hypothetical protein